MNTATLAIFVGLLSALISPLVAYVVAVRRLSGKVSTSDASELWKESTSIREDYRDRLRYSDEQIRRLEERMQRLEETNDKLVDENRRLQGCLDKLTRENAELHAEIVRLKRAVNGT